MRAALVLAVLLASMPSHAKRDAPDRARVIQTAVPATARAAFAPLAAAGWRATWDRETGVPVRITGGFIDVPGAVRDGAIAERAARAFLSRHLSLLAPGARLADWTLVANQLDGELRTIGFAQTFRGLPVHRGQIGFVFGHDRLFAIGSSAWPHVSAAIAPRTTTIVPIVKAGAIEYRAARVIEERSGLERWNVFVAADGTRLHREPRVMRATGTLKYNVPQRQPAGMRVDLPASYATITAGGVTTTTSATGGFSWTGTTATTVVPRVEGTYVKITNRAGAAATDSLTAQPGQSVIWSIATDELADAQLSAYVHMNIAKSRARTINPSAAVWLDTQLDVFVNENGECNASAFKDEIHFQRTGTMCENTARLADVVYHELAHSLHYNSLINGMAVPDSALSEGLADFFAANMTEDAGVGRGIYFTDEPLRDIDPVGSERIYPVDLDLFDPHVSGMIISGALWDLRKTLIRDLGMAAGIARTERIFTGILQRADDISTTFDAALIADDNDGNLGNLTPNYCAIERAFGAHGLVPGYAPTKVHTPVLDGLAISVVVDTPTGTTCTPPVVSSIQVTWRAGEAVASTFDLVPADTIWSGAFPAQPDFTTISYSVDAVFDDGTIQTFPANPADPVYQLFVGRAIPILCASFDDDPQWEQTTNMGFEWEWAPPVARIGSTDPSLPYNGTHVLGTDVTGDGNYRSMLAVTINTPSVDVSRYERVHLQYWRWLSVEDARYDVATIAANGKEVWRNRLSPAGTLDHIDREWRFHDVDLTWAVEDSQVDVQWTLTTDFSKELGGWNLDDACIVGLDKIRACGDGELDLGENCDDGNTRIDDGCDATCDFEITAGGGGFCSAGNHASGNSLLVVLVVFVSCWRRRR